MSADGGMRNAKGDLLCVALLDDSPSKYQSHDIGGRGSDESSAGPMMELVTGY